MKPREPRGRRVYLSITTNVNSPIKALHYNYIEQFKSKRLGYPSYNALQKQYVPLRSFCNDTSIVKPYKLPYELHQRKVKHYGLIKVTMLRLFKFFQVSVYENNEEKAKYNVLEEVKDLWLHSPFLFTVRDLDVTVTEIKPGE